MSLSEPRPLHHDEVEMRDDEARASDARAHYANSPHVQIVAELLGKLRELDLPWWTAAGTRHLWPTTMRMRWLRQRPDLRQAITSKLTGLPPKAAREFYPDQQATLIDAVVDHGDVEIASFERAFDPTDWMVYGNPREVWAEFRAAMPWDDDALIHQRLVAWLIRAFAADRSAPDSLNKRPLLSAFEIRSAIDPEIWQSSIPFELRVEIDRARMKHERMRLREAFSSRNELAIATPEKIAAAISIAALEPIIDRAEVAMGFASCPAGMSDCPAPSIEAPRPSQIN